LSGVAASELRRIERALKLRIERKKITVFVSGAAVRTIFLPER